MKTKITSLKGKFMKRILKKIVLAVSSIILGTFNVVFADDIKSPVEIYNVGSNNGIVNAAVYIGGWIRYGALIAAVVVLMSKGIKFVVSAPEGKADAKKELIPWAIGVVLLFAINAIINFFSGLGDSINYLKVTV